MDGHVANLEHLVFVGSTMQEQPDELHEYERYRNCSHNWWNEPVYISPCTENGVQLLVVPRY